MPNTRWIKEWLQTRQHPCWNVSWVMVNHKGESIELIKWDTSVCKHVGEEA